MYFHKIITITVITEISTISACSYKLVVQRSLDYLVLNEGYNTMTKRNYLYMIAV